MSEYEGEQYVDYGNYGGDGYVDPNQVSAADMDPTLLANVVEQSSALGAQQAIGQLLQQQQEYQQAQLNADAAEWIRQTDEILNEVDGTWATQKRQIAVETVREHPTMLRESSLGNPEAMAEDFARAYEFGLQQRADAVDEAKRADDNAAFDRIEAAHYNYGTFRDRAARAGGVHRVIEGDR